MPVKIYWCAALVGLLLTLCSFSCSKQSDDMARQTEEQNNITVDFRAFPAVTEFTLVGEQSQGSFVFNSDSSKLYNTTIPGGTYRVRWRLINLTSDNMYKAKWLNSNAGTSVPWESNMFTYNGRYMHGTYTFTKERK